MFPLHFIRNHGTDAARCSCGHEDCARPGKHPLIAKAAGGNGKDDATLDADQIDIWSDNQPHANIAMPTGEPSKVLVIDIDGEQGAKSKAWLASQGYLLHDTCMATTGRGEHLYYRHIKGLKTSASKLAPGIDVRAEGGQIVLPPSKHISGRTYTWVRSPLEMKPRIAPMWIPRLLERIRLDAQRKSSEGYLADEQKKRFGIKRPPMEIIAGYADRVATMGQGQRNHMLNEQCFNAFRDVKRYQLDERDVFDRMLAAALACGLHRSEALPTINSARKAAYAKT